MSHFLCPYIGNKRNEIKHIIPKLPEINDDTLIIDIFAGSACIAFNIWLTHPNNKYIINDIDADLIGLYNEIKKLSIEEFIINLNSRISSINSDRLNLIRKKKTQDDCYDFIVLNKMYTGPYKKLNNKPIKLNAIKEQFLNFIKSDNVIISQSDWLDVYNKYNDKNTLFVFDPPYVLSCNEYYSLDSKSMNPYEYFYKNKIELQESYIMFILENVWFIEMLFKDHIKYKYKKQYAMTKRNTEHIIIANYQINET